MGNLTTEAYKTNFLSTWCPGCGNFAVWKALQDALVRLSIEPEMGLIIYGIGCHGNMHDWMNTYGIRALHGRTVPVAQGVKLANHKLPVIVVSGDGDCLGEGGNHLIHAAKRNPDITVLIHDNQVYGLTTGQASPTAEKGLKTKSTPEGATDESINPLALAIVSGATFVARGFAGDIPGLTELIVAAVNHKGFSVLNILQPCITFDKVHTYGWYRERLYKLETQGYLPDNKFKALELAFVWGEKIPLGVFYKEEKPTSEDHEPALAQRTLVESPLEIADLEAVLNEFY